MENRICRTCLKKCNTEENTSVYQISSILLACATISIDPEDGLPTDICQNCVNLAVASYNFKQLCENSDKILRSKRLNFKPEECEYLSSEESACAFSAENEPSTDILIESECSKDSDTIKNETENVAQATLEISSKQNKFLCKFCNLPFMYKRRLQIHEKRHENGMKCYICDKECATMKQLSNHMNIHKRKGAHLCQTCGKQFTFPENLLRHERIHKGFRPYRCIFCKKTFAQSGELKNHTITHTNEKAYLCSFCGSKFTRQGSLQIHIRRLHKSRKESHLCSLCGRAFKDQRDLRQHTLIHSGERKHICKVCNKAFNRSSNLKVHERIHSGSKPFSCHLCHKAFIQKHVLNSHLKTHPQMLNV